MKTKFTLSELRVVLEQLLSERPPGWDRSTSAAIITHFYGDHIKFAQHHLRMIECLLGEANEKDRS